jgi:hypothetical protein
MRKLSFFLGLNLLLLAAPASADIPVVQTEDSQVDLGAMIQLLGLGQHLTDPKGSNDRVYLFLKEGRFRASGRHKRFAFHLELALGGEDSVLAPSPGISLGLLDLNFDIPLCNCGAASLKVGQFKVPYGREQLGYSGFSNTVERSLDHLGFRVGRDIGLAAVARPGKFTLIGGVFAGAGRDVPPARYLPEKLGVPLLVFRGGYGDVDDDLFALRPSEPGVDHLKWAVFANVLYSKDTLAGHSTLFNVKTADKSLLLNSNWNPYLAQAPFSQGAWVQAGGDFALRAPLGRFALAAELQADWARYTNRYGQLTLFGARAQFSALLGGVEAGVRYAFLVPDERLAAGTVAITGKTVIHEVTPALSYTFLEQHLKLVLDLPVSVNAPVVLEPDVGAYLATELPDQVALLTRTGTLSSQTVIEGRLMLQAQF